MYIAETGTCKQQNFYFISLSFLLIPDRNENMLKNR